MLYKYNYIIEECVTRKRGSLLERTPFIVSRISSGIAPFGGIGTAKPEMRDTKTRVAAIANPLFRVTHLLWDRAVWGDRDCEARDA